jgi:hypothetical protein
MLEFWWSFFQNIWLWLMAAAEANREDADGGRANLP